MTLVAFQCFEDRAEIAVDSLSYYRNLGKLGSSSKVYPLPHIDAAAISQGDGPFGVEAKILASGLSVDLGPDAFDLLPDTLRPHLLDIWQHVQTVNRFVYDSSLF